MESHLSPASHYLWGVSSVITRYKQENSKQIKQFLDKISKDFDVIYEDDLAIHGVSWANTLLETLVDLGSTTEYSNIFTKMQTLPVTKQNFPVLKRGLKAQLQRLLKPFIQNKRSKRLYQMSLLNPMTR